MAAEVRLLQGHHHDVAGPDGNLLLAAWAKVNLSSLGGLDASHLDALVRSTGRQLDELG